MVALFLFFKEMTGALAPFSYLVLYVFTNLESLKHYPSLFSADFYRNFLIKIHLKDEKE
jgi:hypothetical protein